MMSWLFAGMVLISIIAAIFSGRMQDVSNAAISSCTEAVMLAVRLMGAICLWNGLMKIAQQSGLTKIVSRILRPATRLLFYGLPEDSPALSIISMNITANLLGLGNAATPLGIAAMCELSKHQPPHLRDTASVHMITLVVLNCASVQLLPTTIALLRLQNGAANPMDVIPAILITSFIALAAGLLCVRLLSVFDRQQMKSKTAILCRMEREHTKA